MQSVILLELDIYSAEISSVYEKEVSLKSPMGWKLVESNNNQLGQKSGDFCSKFRHYPKLIAHHIYSSKNEIESWVRFNTIL